LAPTTHDTALTSVTAAQFDELAAKPAFRSVRWLTATYYAPIKTLSAYGSDSETNSHHLIVTEVDPLDSKRAVEIIVATGVVSQRKAAQMLETRRLWCSFTHPSLHV
jgi:hypothetical protein